jgi:hypothetical protein
MSNHRDVCQNKHPAHARNRATDERADAIRELDAKQNKAFE